MLNIQIEAPTPLPVLDLRNIAKICVSPWGLWTHTDFRRISQIETGKVPSFDSEIQSAKPQNDTKLLTQTESRCVISLRFHVTLKKGRISRSNPYFTLTALSARSWASRAASTASIRPVQVAAELIVSLWNSEDKAGGIDSNIG